MGYALGIDLGTTFTGAAIVREGRAEIVPLGNHAATIPTMVFLRDDDNVLIGDAAERRGLAEPARLAREFKRRLGDTAPIMLDRTPFSADRLLALMLRQIISDITERQGAAPDVVSVTHPANWGEFKIDLLRQAVQLAGVAEAVFLTEPVAAALQYAAGERVDPGEAVAIYDLGGGTFDAAVLRKTEGGFELLGRPQGIERLGGIDFDEAVFTHVRKVVGDVIADLDVSDPPTRAALARLRQECVLAKESLSADSDATVPVLLPNVQTQVRITRVEFEDMIRPILRETIDSLKRAIESSGMTAGALKAVLLAGGSSRIPLIADMVRSELGRPVVTDSHPKHSVALGAARFAAAEGGVLSSQAPTISAPVVERPAAAVPPSPAPPAPPVASVPVASPREPVPVVGSTAPPRAPVRAPIAAPPGGGGGDGPKRPAWIWAAAAAGVAAVVVVAILALGGGGDGGSADPGTTAAAAAETTATDSSTTATTAALSTTSTDAATGAATQLTDYLDADRPTADGLVGTYVPQLAAKYVGLDYEGVLYGPVEILDEHLLLRGAYETILVDGGEYAFTMGEDNMEGWYLTIVPSSFATKDAANEWCTAQGFDVSTCFARLFMPPASAAENVECGAYGGACVGIAAAVWSSDTLYVSYLVEGFDPIDCGCDGTYHVHFFFDTVPVEQAGMPGSGQDWYAWDADDGGGELVFTGLTTANLADYNYADGASLCIAQASYDHTLTDPSTYYCFAVPSPGQ